MSIHIGVPALFAGLFGLVYLPQPDVRAHRRSLVLLAVGTVLCFALMALMLTPYGFRLQNWLLD